MQWRRSTSSRWLTTALIFAVAAGALSLMALLEHAPAAVGADAGPGATARSTADLQFLVVDGDSDMPVPNVKVGFRDQNNVPFAEGLSDAQGLLTLTGVDVTAPLTAVPDPGSPSVSFPVPVTALMVAAPPIKLPVYRDDQQWTTWAKTNDRRHVGPPTGKPKGRPVWTFDPRNMLEYPPCLAYGLVIYGSYHGFVNANRQSDGELVWQQYPGNAKAPSKFANQVAVSSWVEDGKRVARVYFADLTGIVGALDAFDGHYIWSLKEAKGPGTGGKTIPFKSFEASPLVQGETLYLASRYNKNGGTSGLWALDRRTGEVRWFRKLGATRNSKIGASPAYRSGRVFVASYDGNLYAVDATSGQVKWRRKLSGSFYGTPAIAGTRLYVGSNSNGVLYCVDTRNGRVIWQRDLGTSIHSSPAVYNGKLYLGVGKTFMAVSIRSGSPIWSARARTKVWGSATVLNGLVYWSDFGKTYASSSRSGKVVWTFNAGRYSPVTATRHLIVLSGKRLVYAFKPSN
jgi:outer membrane protein assembly factor BamB